MPLPEMERARLGSGLSGDMGSATQSTAPLPSYDEPTHDGLDQAIENSKSDWWTSGAMLPIRQLALAGRGFTVDHIREMAGEPEDPHYWGALFAAAQKVKIIEAVGARVGRDGRLVRVWWGLP